MTTLRIRNLRRFKNGQEAGYLEFEDGVNLIVGDKNTGKTTWLSMLDYLLCDSGTVESALKDMAEEYDSIEGELVVAGQTVIAARRWKEKNLKTKIIVDDKVMDPREFSDFLLERLNIPSIKYPPGKPDADREWNTLTWRGLYRHIYRQAKFWDDLVEEQSAAEFHACLAAFLGIADVVYPDGYQDLVKLRKRKTDLEARKEQFMASLGDVTTEITRKARELNIAASADSIHAAIQNANIEIEKLSIERDAMLQSVQSKWTEPDNTLEVLQSQWQSLQESIELRAKNRNETSDRLHHLRRHFDTLQAEVNRIERAIEAGKRFADVKVAFCPVCDQKLDTSRGGEDECYLCLQPDYTANESALAARRLDFELLQKKEELAELQPLLDLHAERVSALSLEMAELQDELGSVENSLRPFRAKTSALIQPGVSNIDQMIGRLHERTMVLDGIRSALDKRQALNQELQELQKQIGPLEAKLDTLRDEVDYQTPADHLGDGMRDYLLNISKDAPARWPIQDPLKVRISTWSATVLLGKRRWQSKVGDTFGGYFALAYNYGLLNLTGREDYRYPGLLVVDFPKQFADVAAIADKENYLIEPFIQLVQRRTEVPLQVIVAGHSFTGIQGANVIPLVHVWV